MIFFTKGIKIMLTADAIYKIVWEKDFNIKALDHCVALSELDETSGFMHVSFGRQVHNTVNKFFQGQGRVVVLEVDVDELALNGTHLRVESNKPGGEAYPHLYGTQKIPLSAIKRVLLCQNGQWRETLT